MPIPIISEASESHPVSLYVISWALQKTVECLFVPNDGRSIAELTKSRDNVARLHNWREGFEKLR